MSATASVKKKKKKKYNTRFFWTIQFFIYIGLIFYCCSGSNTECGTILSAEYSLIGLYFNCSSYFTTTKISFTSILYPQFTHMIFIIYTSRHSHKDYIEILRSVKTTILNKGLHSIEYSSSDLAFILILTGSPDNGVPY